MKEVRFFYDPLVEGQLPEEEARHVVRVLRLDVGDDFYIMDGRGTFYHAEITLASNHKCLYRVVETLPQPQAWSGHLHLAMAPTKMLDRIEWFVEKATEIGFDELSFLDTRFSERHVVKTERIAKIMVSAVKQSHKSRMPVLNEMCAFAEFIRRPILGDKFICHCYDGKDVGQPDEKPHLMDVLNKGVPSTVLVGPEGDFSVEEVRMAIDAGYRSVSLGTSRLRTETAALVAVHLMQLKNQI